jgi:hypothetical protein
MRKTAWGLLPALLPILAWGENSPLGMSYVDTKELEIIYFDPLQFLVPRAESTLTRSLEFERKVFGWIPSDRLTLLLKDGADYGNAATLPAPNSRIIFDVAPESHAFETNSSAERFYSTMNHELVHSAQGDMASDEDLFWRKVFLGKVAAQPEYPETLLYNYLTVPRFIAPRWYLEGGAVFMETWMGGGLGRAQGGYDEMVFRAMVRDQTKFYDPLGLISKGVRVDFQVGANAYLYGTRFMTWLAYQYSPQQVVAWMKRDEGSKRNYHDQFKHVFGLSLEDAWQKWIAFEHQFQQRNIALVSEHPITPYNTLTASAVGSISRVFYDERTATLYGGFRYPGVVEHIGAINTRTGKVRRLTDIKHGMLYRVTSLAFDPAGGTLFYTNNNLKHRDLMSVDIKTGKAKMLLSGARIGELVFNPIDRSLLGVRHANGIATLVRVPYPYTEWYKVHEFPYESVPYDLDISSDGRMLSASVGEPNGDQFVRVWELAKVLDGDIQPLSQFKFGQSVPESFVFSKDGRYLYGSSYYTGVSNIFRYEVATGDVVAVSNAEIGFFRPLPLTDGRILVLAYSGEGFVPATIDPHPIQDVSAIQFLGAELARTQPIVTTWQVPAPNTADYPNQVIRQGPFVPWRSLALENAYPVLQGYQNAAGLGYHVNIADPLGFARIGLTAAYTPIGYLPESQKYHFDATAEYLGWHGEFAHNLSDFYDLFGPTKISRKGDALKFGYEQLLIYDEPRRLTIKYDVAHFENIDTLPQAQNVATPFTRLTKEQVAITYTNVRRSIGAVDDEKGISWGAVGTEYQADGGSVSQLRGNVDFGVPLPLAHTSLWLRTAAGISNGASQDPLSSFFFGGFGNNYVDHGKVKRFEDYDSLPGFGIDAIGGQRFERILLEANLPPIVFETEGVPGFYVNWLRTSIFGAVLDTSNSVQDPAGSPPPAHTHLSLGAQSELHFSVLYWNELTLSAGFAEGFENSRRVGNELMVSLKIM